MVHGNGPNFATLVRSSWPFQRGSTVAIYQLFFTEASIGLGYCRCLRLCVCVCSCVCMRVNPELVRAITHHPLKLGLPNSNQKCETPWLRFPYLWEWLTLTFKVKFNLKIQIYPIWACLPNNSSPIQAGITKLDQKWKTPWLKSLLFWGLIDIDPQGQI